MGVKLFIYGLFIIAIGAHFYEIDIEIDQKKKEERPLVTFNTAIMYTMDEYEVRRIVQANIAAIFNNREELYEAFIVERAKGSADEEFTDTLKANFIEKKGDFVTLRGDVKYNRGVMISLDSEELFYDLNKKIGYNNKPFEMIYNGQKLTGKDINFNANTRTFEAKDTYFEIITKDNNETK